MSTLTSQIQSLLAYANEKTGKADTTIGDAIKSLADGYSGASGDSVYPNITDSELLGSKFQSLIAYANGITSKDDTTLGDAIKSLCEGYGSSMLPSGYTECEYISSNGKSVIDTMVNCCLIDEIRIKLSNRRYRANGGFFGCRRGITYFLGLDNSGSFYSVRGNTSYDPDQYTPIGTEYYFIFGEDYISINGEIIKTFNVQTSSTTNNYYIFNYNGINVPAYMNLYNFSITRSGVCLINLIPCLDSNGVPCLYDTIGKKTLYNSGSETFGYKTIYGIEVNPT